MGRPRKPTNVLLLSGAFRKNPKRARPNEPEVTQRLPFDPPENLQLTEPQAEVWRELAAEGTWLKSADMPLFSKAVVLEAEWRKMKVAMHPSLLQQARMILNLLGFSPSGRAQITATKTKQSKFDDIA